MLYAVIAYEQMYGGMHGMVSYFVIEGTEKDAEEAAIDESYYIMESYSSIMEDLEAAAAEEVGWDEDEFDEYMEDSTSGADEEYTNALNELMKENLQYEIYPIVKETNLSLEQLDNLFNNNPDDFLREYCIPNFSNGWR